MLDYKTLWELHNKRQEKNIVYGRTRLVSKKDRNGRTQIAIAAIRIRWTKKLGWHYTQKITTQPVDALSNMGVYHLKPMAMIDGITYQEVPYGTDVIVNVEFDGMRQVPPELHKEYLERNCADITIGKGFIGMTVPTKAGFAERVLYLNGDPKNVVGTDDIKEYRFASSVPSKQRKWIATFVQKDYAQEYEEALMELHGSWIKPYLNRENEIKDVVKKSAKVMLLAVPGILYDLDLQKYGVGILFDVFGGEQERNDGGGIISDALMADIMDVDREHAMSLCPQARPMRTGKMFMRTSTLNQMETFELIVQENMDKETHWFATAEELVPFIRQANEEKWYVHIGNPDRLDIISDLDGWKNIPLISDKENGILVLDTGKKSSGHTNLQLLQYSMDMPGFEDTLFEIGRRSIHCSLTDMIRKRKYIMGLDINLDDLYVPRLNLQISPYTLSQGYLRSGEESSAKKGINNAIHRMHFRIEGDYLKTICSPENWTCKYEDAFLHEHEVYINNPASWGKTVEITRNPRSSGVEHYTAYVPSLKEILDRIESSCACAVEKDYYAREYAGLSSSVMVTTGSLLFKDSTGGSDFDGDGEGKSEDENLNRIIGYNEPHSVAILGSKKSAGTVVCKTLLDFLQVAFVRTLTTGNKSIPEIAIENSKICTILNCDEKMRAQVYTELISNMDLPEQKLDAPPYKRRFVGDCAIGEDEVIAALTALGEGPRTLEAMDAFMQDATVMFVSIIGRIIDSAKTGESVTDPFGSALDCIHQLFRERDHKSGQPYARVEWDMTKLTFVPRFTEKSFIVDGDNGKQFYLSDSIYRVQIRLVQYVCQKVKWMRRLAIPSQEEEEAAKNTRRNICCACSIKELGQASSDLQNINVVSDIDSRAAGKKAINSARPYLAGHIRHLLDMSGIAGKDRFRIVTSVYDICAGSSFAYNTLKEETVHYAMTLKNACTVIRERILPVRDGAYDQVQTFVQGRSPMFVCTSYSFDGRFRVEYDESFGWYFEVPLADIVHIPQWDGKLLFRADIRSDEERNLLMECFRERDKHSFYITTYFGDKTKGDALWSGSTKICRIIMPAENFTAQLHKTKIVLDDIIKESFRKSKDGGFREINSVTLLCRDASFAGAV